MKLSEEVMKLNINEKLLNSINKKFLTSYQKIRLELLYLIKEQIDFRKRKTKFNYQDIIDNISGFADKTKKYSLRWLYKNLNILTSNSCSYSDFIYSKILTNPKIQ